MDIPFDTEWSDEARLTFNRLPVDRSAGAVQAGLIKQLPELVKNYADLYRRRPGESVCVGTASHMQPVRRGGSRLEYVVTLGNGIS